MQICFNRYAVVTSHDLIPVVTQPLLISITAVFSLPSMCSAQWKSFHAISKKVNDDDDGRQFVKPDKITDC